MSCFCCIAWVGRAFFEMRYVEHHWELVGTLYVDMGWNGMGQGIGVRVTKVQVIGLLLCRCNCTIITAVDSYNLSSTL